MTHPMVRLFSLATVLLLVGCSDEAEQLQRILDHEVALNTEGAEVLAHLAQRQDELREVRARQAKVTQIFDAATLRDAVTTLARDVKLTVTPARERVLSVSFEGARSADGSLSGIEALDLPTLDVRSVKLSSTGWSATGEVFLASADCKPPLTPGAASALPPSGVFSTSHARELRQQIADRRADYAKLERGLIDGGVRFVGLERKCLDEASKAEQPQLHRATFYRTIRLVSVGTPLLEGEFQHGPVEGIFKGLVPPTQTDSLRARLESELKVRKWDPPFAIVLVPKPE